MMLGALVQHDSPSRILDAGAGCGVLGLMMAQRFPQALVTCIEVDAKSADECYKNVESSPFHDRIQVIHDDLLNPSVLEYDLIISNPPYYFTDNSSSLRNSIQKHSNSEAFSAWIRACFSLLSETGSYWMIYPSDQLELIAPCTGSNDFHEFKRITLLNQHNEAVRTISAYSKQAVRLEEQHVLLRNHDGTYTSQYLELTKDLHSKKPLK